MLTDSPTTDSAQGSGGIPLITAAFLNTAPQAAPVPRRAPPPAKPGLARVFELPLARMTMRDTLEYCDQLIAARRPGYFITANLHYAMLNHGDTRVRTATNNAAFVLADGMPLVWWSKLVGPALPERVAGSDLVYLLAERAALRGYRLFLLGGAEGVADEAAARLKTLYPGLQVVGVEVPPFRPLSAEEENSLVERIRAAKPDILFAALGQPRGELWLKEHHQRLGAPLCAQIGASLDFVAGRVERAPKRWQRSGVEWLYRLLQEPKRLLPRYLANVRYLASALPRDLVERWTGRVVH